MRLRNGEHGYGVVTKLLHWLTVVAIVTQFVVGWTMSADDDAIDRSEDQLTQMEERRTAQSDAAEERFEERLDRLEEELDAEEDRDVSTLHIMLGLSIIGLALVRLLWRRTTPLPPWAEHLSASERKLESWLEKLLLTFLLVVPATGLLLIVGEDGWLPVHVAAQVGFLAVIAAHVGLVLKHTVVRRNRHLSRMM